MNYRMTKALLVLIMIFFVANEGYSQRNRGEYRQRAGLIESLNLTDAQKDKISDLRTGHQEEIIKLRAELELKQLDLQKLKNSKETSRSDYLSSVKEISAAKSKMAESRANHRMDVYELLDDDQKKEFLSRGDRGGNNRVDAKRMGSMRRMFRDRCF